MNENEVEATHVTDGSTGSSNKDISETGSTPNPKTSENGAECLHCQDKLEKEEMDEIIDTEFPKKAESLSEVHLKTDTDHSQNPSESKNNSISISKDDEHMIKFKQNDHKQRHTSDKHISEPFSKENEIRDLRDDDIFFETLKMSRVLEDRLTEIPGALEYIKKLHHLIDKHIKKIRKLRKKLNEQTTKNCKDSFTQTDVEHPVLAVSVSEVAEKEVKIEVESKPKSLAEDIAEAAEMAVQNSGFVYEETSGMYYDYNTGYYYNAEYGLYYDGSTGTYMNYNQDTQSYEFHSQVCVADNRQPEKKTNHQKRKNKGKTAKEQSKRKCKENQEGSGEDDVEEGECSDSSASSDMDDASSEHESDSSEIAKAAPCMRVIVEATEVPSLKVGSLFIITRDGGTLGREGHHSVLIPDVNVSKHHLKFTYDQTDGCYYVTDLGSRNGTLLNGKRLSPSKQESELSKIQHGSKIQIGSTILLCHIHDGSQTCGHCEPGLLQKQNLSVGAPRIIFRYNRAERHKNELKSLKKLCGIKPYNQDSKLAEGYTDRAQKRRDTVGSQNPHEKTQVASVDESISKENKGFKLLQKMGWKEGESLGKENEGIVEPIKVTANQGTTGIGAETSTLPGTNEKSTVWVKTQERFNKLPESRDILGLDSD